LDKKFVAVTILFIVAFAAVAPLGAPQNTSTVTITALNPSSGSAPAGATVTIQGTIASVNASYQVIFGRDVVASGKSDGYYVNANFTVPEYSAGIYVLKLQDVVQNINSTGTQFSISIGYTVATDPLSVQEGDSIVINAAVTGGQPGVNYAANIAVMSPSGTTYTAIVELGTPNVRGTTRGQVTFPSSFSPSDASTTYAGTYYVRFNDTLARYQFSVSILDATSYHRGQTLTIHAIGYQPNQAASITFTSGSAVIDTKQVAASADGIISATWVVSDNAPIGDCTVKITPDGAQKLAVDQQTFKVEGYTVQVQARNLSGQTVPTVTIQASDDQSGTVTTATTDTDGLAFFKLERGSYGLTALVNNIVVGLTNITVTGDGSFTLTCQLTDTTINVKNTDGIGMPYVDLEIKFSFQGSGNNRSGNLTGKTNAQGAYVLASTLAGATYTVDASVHGKVFNRFNNTFSNLPNIAHPQVTIICPAENLTLGVTGYNHEAIPDARIELVELSNGLFYSATTATSGNAKTQVTFGIYRVRVYEGNALINETTLEVFSETQKQIQCTLYGIQLTVSVVDLFGSPIPNAKVTLNGATSISATTMGNGIATFDNIIGGNMQILTQAPGSQDASQSITVTINQPARVQVKIDKYISLGGMLVGASTLITVIIVLIAIVLFALVEVYLRRRTKTTPAS